MDALDAFLAEHGTAALLGAAAVLAVGGFAKGAVGFALPTIAIAGLGAIFPAQLAVALLVIPALVANVQQAFRTGFAAAAETLWRHRVLNLVLFPTIAAASQLLAILDETVIFLILGVGVTGFSLIQLSGLRPPDPSAAPRAAEIGTGLVAGFFGGVSGSWGPPILLYLLARRTPKVEQVRAMGVSFLIGAIVLTASHLVSGVLNARTIPLSLLGVLPVALGMALGIAVQDRMSQEGFQRATLIVLTLAGLNLLRRALV